MIFLLRLALFFLILIRLPWTIYRFFRAYHYARYIDHSITHDGAVILTTPYGQQIKYIRGRGLTLFKFLGAFNDR